jgi:signal transduction histidine kinase
MSINIPIFTALVVTTLAYVILFFYILRRDEPLGAERWMVAYSLWSVLVAGALTLSDTRMLMLNYASGIWLALASFGGLCLLGGLTFQYLELNGANFWLGAALPVMGILLWADFQDPALGLREMTWQAAIHEGAAWLPLAAALSWGIAGFALIAITFNSVTESRLPLQANRRLWWVIALSLILVSEAIAMWSLGPITILGQGLRVIGVLVAAYATTIHDLADIRSLVRAGIGNAFFVALLTLITLGAIALSVIFINRLPAPLWQLAVAGAALVLAVIYQVIRPRMMRVVQRVVLAAGYDTAQIVADYSKQVANLLDIDQLTITMGLTLAQAVQSSRLALLVITPGANFIQADVLIGAGKLPTTAYQFDNNSQFLKTLTGSKRPLLQYTIDYSPQFRTVQAAERAWLNDLGMDVYVPVFDGDVLSGIMAVGARQSGDPYRARELELLSAIADQTSVALKNARLVTRLRIINEEMHILNEGMRELNKDLADKHERLKQMDKVKTDFINIASHELRTPLTKIRGYTDILAEMNHDNTIDSEHLDLVTGQLKKASDRLEEVVTQMLDVSQLDVEAMRLTFLNTSMDAILRIASDGFGQALKERNLRLTIQGTSTLPSIQGDFQRLAQAFKEIIGNAVKFTPDGGCIDIYTNHLPANDEKERPDAVEIVVADTGVGIDPSHHELIFEKFFRVGSVSLHSTGNSKFMGAGPGLGLTIARGVIKGHGGQIWVESDGFDREKCPGSQFHVILPLVPMPASNQKSTAST